MYSSRDFETEEQWAAFEAGQQLLRKGLTPNDAEIDLLVEQRQDREAVEAVMPVLHRWRDAAVHGELGYIAWLRLVTGAPTRNGLLVLLLVVVTVLVTLIAGFLGFFFLPPGPYPKALRAIPGVIVGLLFFCIAGWFVYLLQRGNRALTGGPDEVAGLPEPDMSPDDKYSPWKKS